MSAFTSSSPSASPSERPAPAFARGGVSRGLIAGLTPLTLLVFGVAITTLLSAIALSLTVSVGFMTRQAITMTIVIAGLLVSMTAYAIACVRSLRRIGRWQRLGATREATTALWALAATALATLLPIVIAMLMAGF